MTKPNRKRRLFRIGDRWFEAIGPQHFGGDGPAYLRRFIPFGIHRVDIQGLTPDDAAWELWQDLDRRGLLRDVLASAVVEQGHQPSDTYSAELRKFLAGQHDADSLMAQRMLLVNFLKALAMNPDGLRYMREQNEAD